MVFLCHYRNKLIFGFKSEGGDSGEQHVDVRRCKQRDGIVTSKLNQGGCLCAGAKHWISRLMLTMLQEMKERDNAEVAGCAHGGAE